MPKAQTNTNSNRRGRSRGGRGRGRGAAPATESNPEPSASGLSLLQRMGTPPPNISVPSGQTRAFSTTQGLLAGYQSSSRFMDAPLLPQLKNNIPTTWEFMSEIQAQTVTVRLPFPAIADLFLTLCAGLSFWKGPARTGKDWSVAPLQQC